MIQAQYKTSLQPPEAGQAADGSSGTGLNPVTFGLAPTHGRAEKDPQDCGTGGQHVCVWEPGGAVFIRIFAYRCGTWSRAPLLRAWVCNCVL